MTRALSRPSRLGRAAPGLAGGATLWLALFAASCGPAGEGGPGTVTDGGVSADAAGAGGTCPTIAVGADGQCCATGHFWSQGDGGCLPLGPSECAAQVPGASASCSPRWCWDLRDDAGAACGQAASQADLCTAVGRRCTAAETAQSRGCPAGRFGEPDGCHDGGSTAALPRGIPGQSTETSAGLPEVSGPLPPRWCATPDGGGRACGAGEVGCPVGETPTPGAAPGTCHALTGVDWTCPPGFVIDGAAAVDPGAIAPCKPDPADCGIGKWGEPPGGATPLRYVDAAAKPGGDGSQTQPHRDLAAAIAAAPAGACLLLAAGEYAAGVALTLKPLTLRGRCAAEVRLLGNDGQTTVAFSGAAASGSRLERLTVLGPKKGVTADLGAEIALDRVWVKDTTSVAVRARNGAKIKAQDVVVHRTEALQNAASPANELRFGRAFSAESSGKLDLRRVRMHAGRDIALAVVTGSAAVVEEALIDQTRAEKKTGRGGWGVAVLDGSQVVLAGLRLHRNREIALYAAGKGSLLDARQVAVQHTLPSDQVWQDTRGGRALHVEAGATVVLDRALFEHNRERAVLVAGAGSTLKAADIRIADTLPDLHGDSQGRALHVNTGGQVTLERAWLHRNRDVGAFVYEPGTLLQATDLLVQDTRPSGGAVALGRGLIVRGGASAKLLRVRLSGNRDTGMMVNEPGSTLEATDLLIDGTLPRQADQTEGRGLDIGVSAVADLRRARISGNRSVGVLVTGAGTRVRMRDVTVDATGLEESSYVGGKGLGVFNGAQVRAERVRVHRNREVGVQVDGPQTRLWLADASITQTQPNGFLKFGRGAHLANGAHTRFDGVVVRGNHEVGVAVWSSTLDGVGMRVEDTLYRLDGGGLGAGVVASKALDSAIEPQVRLFSTVVARNYALGVAIDGGALELDAVVVTDTRPQRYGQPDETRPEQWRADGLTVVYGSVAVRDSLLIGNPRAGVLLLATPGASMARSEISGGLFGVVLQNGASLKAEGMAIHDNTLHNTVDDLGLLAPPAPPGLAGEET